MANSARSLEAKPNKNNSAQARARSFSLSPEIQVEIDKLRSNTLARWAVERFQHMQPDELAQVQAAMNHGLVYGIWQTPKEWLTKKQAKASHMNIDLRRRLKDYVLDQLQDDDQAHPDLELWLDQAVLTMTRLLLLMRCAELPGKSNKSHCLAPSTVIEYANYQLLKCLSTAIAKGLTSRNEMIVTSPRELRLFGLVTTQECQEKYDGATWLGVLRALEDRLRRWSEDGYWSDTFATQGTSGIEDLKAGKSRNNRPTDKSEEFRPLPDGYAALLAKRSLWLMREIGPNLVRLTPEFAAMYAKTRARVQAGSLSQKRLAPTRSRYARKMMESFVWLDSTGKPLTRIPFRLALTGSSEQHGWLPQTQRDFFDLMAYVQTAHQIITGLTTGLRESELLDMTRGCVVDRMIGDEHCYYLNSRTFKTVASHEGEQREWPVVVQVKQAVESQEQLMARLDEINKADDPNFQPDNHLWGRFYLMSKSGEAFVDTNVWIGHYVEALGMETAPGGQNFTTHRLRKTLARIVALALVNSPMVLYEIFGHHDIEMTLHYILANKDLRLEVEAIAREINVMQGAEVVEVMAQAELRRLAGRSLPGDLYGGCGGGAAGPIDVCVRAEVQKIHERGEEWGANNAIELGRQFTNAGQQWMLVRKGVICTKSPGTVGPCSLKSRGRPEPSKCSSGCSHRLEREFMRDDVRGILDTARKGYEQALADSEEGLAAYWGGQIKINISRFPDIEQEYMRIPSIAACMSGALK